MKRLLILVLIIGLAIGGYYWYQGQNKVRTYGPIEPVEITGTAETKALAIQQKILESKKDLQSLSVALEAFAVDNRNEYPKYLEDLTTPVAYLAQVPMDPFTKNSFFQYEKKPAGYLVWSIGPDGVDNHGSIEYVPSKGSTSPGDIFKAR